MIKFNSLCYNGRFESESLTSMGVTFLGGSMKLSRTIFLSMLVSAAACAQDIKLVGQVNQTIPVAINSKNQLRATAPKQISLLKVELSDKAKQTFINRAKIKMTANTALAADDFRHARKIQLGMNQVPVFDQGAYGTCATFANTAAVDAALNKGDYVSQLCQLQLGQYFAAEGYVPSGWDGSWGRLVLSHMSTFGIVSKTQEKNVGCGGLTAYPMHGGEIGTAMSLSDFHQISEELSEDEVSWTALLDVYQVTRDKSNPVKTVDEIKQSLQSGDRVTLGVLLIGLDLGMVGAVGQHHVPNDTWVLMPEILFDALSGGQFAGHEMVITGYDDDAVATDSNGNAHRGLFTLRNSWGEQVGDHGDFYMSYDYIKTLMLEAQRIRSNS